MGKQETLETIWEVPDELWERIEPIILEEDPPKARGRKALTHDRKRVHGTDCRKSLRQPGRVGSMWGALVEGCEEAGDGRRQTEPSVQSPEGG